MICVENLVKRYGAYLAVDHLTFSVEGGVFGFLGPNGAGKSTTMNMMTGYLEPSGGDVTVSGHSIQKEPLAAKARLGYLPEQPPLYTDMTVEEYLGFAAQLKKVPRREVNAAVSAAMARTHVEEVSRRLIRNLSKGYRQRVGLAMALLGGPETLILDEPTVGLDPKQILEIRELIRDLAHEHTVILSSHILSEVREVCDQILILHHGKAVAQGAPAQLELEMAGVPELAVTLLGDANAAREMLSALPGVEGVEPVAGLPEGQAGFRLTYAPDLDVRETVFRACAAADTPLLEMRAQSATLEDIFLRLTSDEPPVPTDEEAVLTEEPVSGDGSLSGGEAPPLSADELPGGVYAPPEELEDQTPEPSDNTSEEAIPDDSDL